jgi:hypothetical protein
MLPTYKGVTPFQLFTLNLRRVLEIIEIEICRETRDYIV